MCWAWLISMLTWNQLVQTMYYELCHLPIFAIIWWLLNNNRVFAPCLWQAQDRRSYIFFDNLQIHSTKVLIGSLFLNYFVLYSKHADIFRLQQKPKLNFSDISTYKLRVITSFEYKMKKNFFFVDYSVIN